MTFSAILLLRSSRSQELAASDWMDWRLECCWVKVPGSCWLLRSTFEIFCRERDLVVPDIGDFSTASGSLNGGFGLFFLVERGGTIVGMQQAAHGTRYMGRS
jgi:hypothetical protein